MFVLIPGRTQLFDTHIDKHISKNNKDPITFVQCHNKSILADQICQNLLNLNVCYY